MTFRLSGFEDNITHFSANHLLCLDNFTSKIFTVDIGSHKDQLDYLAVLSPGKIACKVNTKQVTKTMYNFFNYPVDTGLFKYYAVNIIKKRMLRICLVDLLVTVAEGMKKSGSLEAVKLNTDGVGGFTEFRFQTSEMSLCAAVEEEFLQ